MKEKVETIRRQCTDTFEAIAIFDALGLPTESLEEAHILKELPTAANEYLRCPQTHPSYNEQVPGRWSDDTQLSLAVAEAIIKTDGAIDMKTIAKKHVDAAAESMLGWGKGTKKSVARLAENNLNYKDSGEQNSAGNGVIMKMMPLILAMHYNHDFESEEKRFEIVQDFTYMTHRSVIALVCSLVHANMLEEVLLTTQSEIQTKEGRHTFLSKSLAHAKKFEDQLGEKEHLLSQRLQGLLDNFDDLATNKTLLAIANGGKCFVPESLTMCYGLLGTAFDFSSAHRAVIIGGDTDSNAAIVGSMVALLIPTTEIPKPLKEGLWNKEAVSKISAHFAYILSKRF